jgi:N6-L-threonylcarbamoyladenine synthase
VYELPRPMLHSGDLSFSFSGLKTAVLTLVREQDEPLTDEFRADAARAFQEAIVEVLVKKSLQALKQTGLGATGRGRRGRRQPAVAVDAR